MNSDNKFEDGNECENKDKETELHVQDGNSKEISDNIIIGMLSFLIQRIAVGPKMDK